MLVVIQASSPCGVTTDSPCWSDTSRMGIVEPLISACIECEPLQIGENAAAAALTAKVLAYSGQREARPGKFTPRGRLSCEPRPTTRAPLIARLLRSPVAHYCRGALRSRQHGPLGRARAGARRVTRLQRRPVHRRSG